MENMKNILIGLVCFVFLLVSLRGVDGNPEKLTLNDSSWKEDGPFELSPERGRFALTYSLVEDESFQFDLPVARFALPDLGYIDGKYVSLFAPGISFLAIPGYYLGKVFGISQVGTFAAISFFAVLNALLINSIVRKLGVKGNYSAIASLAFLFATPAFAYAVSLYQHHVSTFLLLAGVWVFMNFKNTASSWIIWFLAALSIPVDYPNFFMMIPLMILAILRFFEVKEMRETYQIKFRFSKLLSISGVVLPFIFLAWVNFRSYDDPFRLAGTVTNVRSIDERGFPKEDKPTASTILDEFRSGERDSSTVALGFFDSRNISNGIFIHLFSPDRGVIFFAPFLLFAFFGAFGLYKKNPQALALLTGIGLANLFIYSMWGDPWGGWAFGSRYLIPLYAIASILLAIGLENIFRKKVLGMFFFIILIYSVFVNTLGAITTSTNPPKTEILQLEEQSGKEEKYTYERNWDYLNNKGTKSFVYNEFLKDYFTPAEFYVFVAVTLSIVFMGLFSYDFLYSRAAVPPFLPRTKKSNIKDVVVEINSPPFPFKSKIRALEKNIIFNWSRKISLWKKL